MKATFENIGPIKKAELELGDLTIIAGQNNTGKTYLVYTLYGFLASLKPRVDYFLQNRNQQEASMFKDIASQLKKLGSGSISSQVFRNAINLDFRQKSKYFSSHTIGDIFSSSNSEFKNAKFIFELGSNDLNKFKRIVNFNVVKGASASIHCFYKDSKLNFESKNIKNISIEENDIAKALFYVIEKESHPDHFVLSAERVGISLFYKELDFSKNRIIEEFQKKSNKKQSNLFNFIDKKSSRYAKPIKDNIDFVRDLSRIQRQEINKLIEKNRSVKHIMNGYYKISNDEIRFISKGRGDNRFNIPLHLASSSARGVSDLYFYLKHVAKQGQILIIDEPESHLSPTNQILMARLLAFCVNSGLKVLITTHSDYLIKEFNNLIMLNGDFKGKSIFLRKNKKDYSENDNLNPKSVNAYICENGGLQRCDVDERGIDMPNFDDAINKINIISNTLSLLRTPAAAK